MHVRVCRECGEEYRPEIAVCADCGGELVDQHGDDLAPSLADRPAGLVEQVDPEPEGGRILFRSPEARDLTPLADALAEAGVPFRLLGWSEERHRPYYCLVVPDRAAEEARRVVLPVMERDPELRHYAIAEPLSNDEAEAGAAGPSCPACQAHVPPDATECPDCGLVVYREEEPE